MNCATHQALGLYSFEVFVSYYLTRCLTPTESRTRFQIIMPPTMRFHIVWLASEGRRMVNLRLQFKRTFCFWGYPIILRGNHPPLFEEDQAIVPMEEGDFGGGSVLCTSYGSASQRSASLCCPSKATFCTSTRSPGRITAWQAFLSYWRFCLP